MNQHTIKVLNIYHPGRGGLEKLSYLLGFELRKHFDVQSISADNSLFEIWKYVNQSDVVLIHRGKILYKLLPFILLRKPKFIFIHHFMAKAKKKDPYHRFVYSRVSAIIALSKRIAEQMKENWQVDASKVFVLYPGIDIEKFFRSENQRVQVRRKYGIADKEIVLGTVGRICQEKNQKLLLESVKLSGKDFTCFIVGPVQENKYLESLKVTSEKLHIRTIFVPEFVDNVGSIFNAIDFLVITSKNEPFGLVGLESMACSTPVLAPDNSGMAEVISDNEDSFIYHNNSAKSLSSIIRNLAESSQVDILSMSKKAREKVEKNFTLSKYAEKLKDIIYGVLQ